VIPQAQLPMERAEVTALGRLVGWLGAFVPPGRDSTAMEALDDPLSPALSLRREPSSSELATSSSIGLHISSPDLRVRRAALLGLILQEMCVVDDGDALMAAVHLVSHEGCPCGMPPGHSGVQVQPAGLLSTTVCSLHD